MGALLNTQTHTSDAEAVLAISKYIAGWLPSPEQGEIIELAFFVRANLSLFLDGMMSFEQIQDVFTAWALVAPLGQEILRSTYYIFATTRH